MALYKCVYYYYYYYYELSIGTQIGDLQWPWTAKWPIFCAILPNLVVCWAHCVRVV